MSRHNGAHAVKIPVPVQIPTSRGTIQCAVVGEGPAIVALHGGMGGYDQSWLLAKALLADLHGHRVVAVSRPGYLDSPLELGRTPEDQAHVVAALLDALSIPDAAIVAVSAGGPSALQFAALHPSRCRSLILVSACTGPLQTPPEILKRMRMMAILARLPGLPALLRWQATRKPDRPASRSIRDPDLRTRTLGHAEAGPLLRALQSSVFERMRERLPGTLNDVRQFAELSQLPNLPISSPTLIVHGAADTVVPFAHAEAVRQRVPDAELLTIPAGEHVSLFTHLDMVRAKAGKYLPPGMCPGDRSRSFRAGEY